jgi:hypothetical protein
MAMTAAAAAAWADWKIPAEAPSSDPRTVVPNTLNPVPPAGTGLLLENRCVLRYRWMTACRADCDG